MKVGPYELSELFLDRFRLDGGAMFGAVPKTLWSRLIPADEENRIRLACRSIVLKSPERLALVDLGCGDKFDEKKRKIYEIEPQLAPRLEQRALPISDIILTHLHFDHCGGISRREPDGSFALNFPGAAVHVQEKNWERAQAPGPRERATYLPENIEPLKGARLNLAKDGQEILPEVRVFTVNGHTDGMQWILIGKGSGAVALPADLIPTAHHLAIPYLMGYDLCATTTMREKEEFLSQAEREGWWLAFGHDADTALVRVGRDAKGTYIAVEKAALPAFSG